MIPLNRIQDLKSKFSNLFKNASGDGILVLYNNLTATVSIALNYVSKNLKITADGKLDTIQDIDTTASPEFAGLKVGSDSGLLGKETGIVNTVSVSYPLILDNYNLSIDGGGGSTANGIDINATASEALFKGQPIHLSNTKKASLASSQAGYDNFIGLVKDDYLLDDVATITVSGQLSQDDWTAVTGAVDLIPANKYYVSSIAGKLTHLVPQTGYLIRVGYALNERTLIITNSLKVKLT